MITNHHIIQELVERKARIGVIIEDASQLEDIIQSMSNIAEVFLMAVAVQNRVWQTIKILHSDDPKKIDAAVKKLRNIEHIVTGKVNVTTYFAGEEDRENQD